MLLVFFALWIVFNGRLTWEIAAFGVILSGALYAFCRAFLDYSVKKELRALRLVPKAFQYFGTLLIEIVKANLALTRVVLRGSAEVKPRLVTFRTPLKKKLSRCVLADSITLTPGTITALMEDDKLTVHCLDASFAKGIDALDFQRQLEDMERMSARDDR